MSRKQATDATQIGELPRRPGRELVAGVVGLQKRTEAGVPLGVDAQKEHRVRIGRRLEIGARELESPRFVPQLHQVLLLPDGNDARGAVRETGLQPLGLGASMLGAIDPCR